jgi:hypothetical protein
MTSDELNILINLYVCDIYLKNVKKVFYSSIICIHSVHNQLDLNNPNCEESSKF